jgi:hypothetical protein
MVNCFAANAHSLIAPLTSALASIPRRQGALASLLLSLFLHLFPLESCFSTIHTDAVTLGSIK